MSASFYIPFCFFVLLGALEYLFPKRALSDSKIRRWLLHFSLAAINTIGIYYAFGSDFFQDYSVGLFSYISVPFWLELIIALLFFDMVIYWQHRLFHEVPFLWCIHKLHHSDRDLDVTSALRFHFFEISISLCIKLAALALIGASLFSIVLFELLLVVAALFNHSNLSLSKGFDSFLRKMIVTPDMHRVHHSVFGKEMNSNYSTILSFWDRLFVSYTSQPLKGHLKMRIGLSQYVVKYLYVMLLLPVVDLAEKS